MVNLVMMQDDLPEGAMIVPIIAASNKTPVTRTMDELEMHPLVLTIGNISSYVHMDATSHAWQCTVFILIPHFEVHTEFQTILKSCVWHKCIDIVTANLKHAAAFGTFMSNVDGHICYCSTPFTAWTVGLLGGKQ